MFDKPELSIDPSTDLRALVIMWRLGAFSKPGCITKQEFVKGMKALDTHALQSLGNKIKKNEFDAGFLETKEFREFYKFVFQFSREGTNKTIGTSVLGSIWYLYLGS